MQEIYLNNNELISIGDWRKKIADLYTNKELKESETAILGKIIILIECAIKKRTDYLNIINNNKKKYTKKSINKKIMEETTNNSLGIFFSGGLDSSLIAAICKKNNLKFTCYTVGFQDGNMNIPEDVKHAQNVASFLGLTDKEFKIKIFNLREAEKIIIQTAKILSKIPKKENINNIVNLGVGSVISAAYSISNNENFFFSGLGSEELFAGYERHKKNPSNDECFNGLINMYERDLLRDYTISQYYNFKFLTPFLDEELIKYALRIPIKMKINDNNNKIILRKAAYIYLKEFSERPKKAAQYGSSFDKAIAKLALKNGFKTKNDYYESIIKQ
ncbi:MAG: asparagine synthase C-terminal domain-containing protein [Candidatus Woesearchaeota archaeon]